MSPEKFPFDAAVQRHAQPAGPAFVQIGRHLYWPGSEGRSQAASTGQRKAHPPKEPSKPNQNFGEVLSGFSIGGAAHRTVADPKLSSTSAIPEK
jgi:hypothetical protein